MNPDQLTWVTALLNDTYVQGTGVMKRVTNGKAAYCCMGVACELFAHDVLEEDALSNSENRILGLRIEAKGDDVQHTYLPPELNERLGLIERDNEVLAQLNDTYHFTFKEIALVLQEAWARGKPVEVIHRGLIDWLGLMISLKGLEP